MFHQDILYLGERLFVLVGQEGQSACVIQGVESRDGLCAMQVQLVQGVIVYIQSAYTIRLCSTQDAMQSLSLKQCIFCIIFRCPPGPVLHCGL